VADGQGGRGRFGGHCGPFRRWGAVRGGHESVFQGWAAPSKRRAMMVAATEITAMTTVTALADWVKFSEEYWYVRTARTGIAGVASSTTRERSRTIWTNTSTPPVNRPRAVSGAMTEPILRNSPAPA